MSIVDRNSVEANDSTFEVKEFLSNTLFRGLAIDPSRWRFGETCQKLVDGFFLPHKKFAEAHFMPPQPRFKVASPPPNSTPPPTPNHSKSLVTNFIHSPMDPSTSSSSSESLKTKTSSSSESQKSLSPSKLIKTVNKLDSSSTTEAGTADEIDDDLTSKAIRALFHYYQCRFIVDTFGKVVFEKSLQQVFDQPKPCDHFLYEPQSRASSKDPLPKLPPIPTLRATLLVSPMVQVFSVAIHPHFDDDDHCEIYGFIEVHDDEKVFPCYDDAETFSSAGGTLTLTDYPLPDAFVSFRLAPVSMDFCLFDKVRDSVVIDKEIMLHADDDEDVEKSCDKLMKAIVQGQNGCACIYYTKFLHAVTAYVKVDLISVDGSDDCPFVGVYGNITATYGDAKRFCDSDNQVDHMKSTLFDKPSYCPVRVMIGSEMRLSRFVVAVPPYSSLIIEADLKDSAGQIVRGSAEFGAIALRESYQVIRGGRGAIKVDLHWRDGYRTDQNNECDCSHFTPAYKNIHPEVFGTSDDVIDFGRLLRRSKGEVFSVYVSGKNHNVSSVCGEVRVNDVDNWNMLPSPHSLGTDKMIATLEAHHEIYSDPFSVEICLQDPANNLEISRGYIGWSDEALGESCDESSLFDRALCSMVRGSDGYAVVHYMIFHDACLAKLEMSFYHNDSSSMNGPVNIYGSVVASYSNFNYSTAYLKKYFRSRLFDKPVAESVQVTSGSKIPLLKTVMAVSTYGSLVIEVNLKAMSMDNTVTDTLCGKKLVKIDFVKKKCKVIRGEHCRVKLSVEFEMV